jgi:hypothetical protein
MSYESEIKFQCTVMDSRGETIKFHVSSAGVAGDSSKLLIGESGGLRMCYMYDTASIFSSYFRRRGIRKIVSAFEMIIR